MHMRVGSDGCMSLSRTRRRTLSLAGLAAASVIVFAACSTLAATDAADTASAASGEVAASALWDSASVHSISVDFDQDAYDAMIQTYLDSGEKEWIEAPVRIDGVPYESVGLKLKGNSSLRSVNAETAENPQDLP